MMCWSDALARLQRTQEAHVLITVLGTAGSVPRDCGSKMLVTAQESWDTLGGGQLEWQAMATARELLQQRCAGQQVVHYPLAAELGQCCGGHVTLLYECFFQVRQALWLFGAGHVGQALMPVLAQLPLQCHWVDSREAQIPMTINATVKSYCLDKPEILFEQIQPLDIILIMTHSHDQDFTLCAQALACDHQGFIGLIGSRSKAGRFRLRLQRQGFSADRIARIESPVGLSQVPGKRPMEVAIAIAARIIQVYSAQSEPASTMQIDSHATRNLQTVLQSESKR